MLKLLIKGIFISSLKYITAIKIIYLDLKWKLHGKQSGDSFLQYQFQANKICVEWEEKYNSFIYEIDNFKKVKEL
ncbi:MAG: hypothetical protein ABFD75_12210 [Smithella sp.]